MTGKYPKKRLHLKTKEQRTDLKDSKRVKAVRTQSKSKVLDMVEALIANGCVKNGMCRHNHHYSVLSTGKILVDGEPGGYIDKDYTDAAKYLISHGYYIRYVRNSPVIHDPDGEPTLITVWDLSRRR